MTVTMRNMHTQVSVLFTSILALYVYLSECFTLL